MSGQCDWRELESLLRGLDVLYGLVLINQLNAANQELVSQREHDTRASLLEAKLARLD